MSTVEELVRIMVRDRVCYSQHMWEHEIFNFINVFVNLIYLNARLKLQMVGTVKVDGYLDFFMRFFCI